MNARQIARLLPGRAKDDYVLSTLKAIEALDESGDVDAFVVAIKAAIARAEAAVG